MKKNRIALFLVAIVVAVSTAVFAAIPDYQVDETKTGSLTINVYEQQNGSTETDTEKLTGIAGVEYTLYYVSALNSDVDTVEEAEALVTAGTATNKGAQETTDTDFSLEFTDLPVGRYYAKVTAVPEGTTSYPESFLVDIPTTNASGTAYEYNITANPKILTAVGTLTIKKVDSEGNGLTGVTFKVQYREAGSTADWKDYVKGLTTAEDETDADKNGTVTTTLPRTIDDTVVEYRVIEVSTLTGYVIDNSSPKTITVSETGVLSFDGTESTTGLLTVINEMPTLTKKVKTASTEYADSVNAGATDTLTFKLTTDLPTAIASLKTYKIVDTLPTGITAITANKVTVTGITKNGSATLTAGTEYSVAVEGQVVTITFDPSKLGSYASVVVTYDTTIDSDNISLVVNGDGNVNTAVLTYSTSTDDDSTDTITDTATVTTGELQLLKVDATDNTKVLEGAKFSIASSLDNAKAGIYLTDENGNTISVTTGSDGTAKIVGLAYGEYYLVETQAPTYTEDGVTKSYSLISPTKVTVSATDSVVQVEDKKPFTLPATGGIGSAVFLAVGITLIVIAKSVKKQEKEQ